MRNIDSLLSNVDPIKHTDSFIHPLVIKRGVMDGNDVYFILEHIKWFEIQQTSYRLKIIIQSKNFKSTDVISVLEIIMLYLAKNLPKQASLFFTRNTLLNQLPYFKNSLLSEFDNKILGKHYIDKFYEVNITMNHMRTLFEQENPEKDFIPSKAMFDTEKFIKNISQNQISTIDEDVIGNIAEISSEIIDNCFQHSDGDCLYDVKCFPTKSNKLFVSLNFISLTNDFIGKELIDLYKRKELKKYSGYKIVKKAYKYHSKHFSSNYNDGSFGFVCSFQEKVSTRKNSIESGGTGLTALIKNIHNKSFDDNYMSYVISANNTLVFDNNFLKVSKEGNIGFNSKNNFFKCLPENKIVIKENYTFPGTIFSINLIL